MLRAFGWIFGPACAAAILAFATGMALPSVVDVNQSEGGYTMAVAFGLTPAAFALGAILGQMIWIAGCSRG